MQIAARVSGAKVRREMFMRELIDPQSPHGDILCFLVPKPVGCGEEGSNGRAPSPVQKQGRYPVVLCERIRGGWFELFDLPLGVGQRFLVAGLLAANGKTEFIGEM